MHTNTTLIISIYALDRCGRYGVARGVSMQDSMQDDT